LAAGVDGRVIGASALIAVGSGPGR
jgi:hypothetical protein